MTGRVAGGINRCQHVVASVAHLPPAAARWNYSRPAPTDLVRRGLATASAERVVAGEQSIEVARIRITAAGRKALRR
jgi:hypothetical protein